MEECISMILEVEKKHSVRYKSVSDDSCLTTIYVSKRHLPTPYPRALYLIVQDEDPYTDPSHE
jgi:hypothetical protein